MITSIRIGAIDFKVEEVERLIGSNSEGTNTYLNGRIKYEQALISVEKNVATAVKPAILWHECLHGLLDRAGYEEHPEDVITALGYGLVEIIRDNPKLIAFTLDPNLS